MAKRRRVHAHTSKMLHRRSCSSKLVANSSSDNSSDEDDALEISCHNNHVYFYCDVTKQTVLKLQKVVNELKSKYDKIVLHINSDGGCAFSGLFAMDFLDKHNVSTVAEGMCARTPRTHRCGDCSAAATALATS